MDEQTKADRIEILGNLPEGTRRVKVLDLSGKEMYKKPEEVDVENDLIQFNKVGEVIIMRGKPGPMSRLPAVSPQVADVQASRSSHISYNRLLTSTRKQPDADGVFDLIMKSMAADVASLEFEIEEQVRKGLDPSQTVAKKSRVLKSMADSWIARKKISKDNFIDIDSEQFSSLFGFILSTMRESMVESGARREQIETIFNRFSSTISKPAWESEAKKIAEGK